MTAGNDDYDPNQLIQELSANLTQPDRFAEIFCTAAHTQKKIDETLRSVVRQLIKSDHETIAEIKVIIKKVAKEDLMVLGKNIGFATWSIILIIATALITKWLG